MKRFLLGACFVVTWSSGFVGTGLAGDEVGWRPLLAWRYVLTAVMLVTFCVTARPRGVRVNLTARELGRQVILGLMAHVVFLGGVFAAAETGLDAGLSALVCALQPLLVTLASRPLFGDRVHASQVAGLLLGLAGVGCSLGGVDMGATAEVGFVFASLIALSASAMLERRWSPQTPLLLSVTMQTVTAAVAFTALAATTDTLSLPATGSSVRALLWLVVLSGLGGYCSYIACLRTLGASATSTLLYLTPPVTTLWAWVMFAQRPGDSQWIGLGVVMLAVAVTLRGSNRHVRGPRSPAGVRRTSGR